MSLGTDAETAGRLVEGGSSTREIVAGAAVVLSFVAFVTGFLALLGFLPVSSTVAGLPVGTLLGAMLSTVGTGTLALGVASRADLLDTRPDHTGGLVNAVVFGLVWFVVVGMIAAQSFGLATLWPAVALLVGVPTAAFALLAREDLGITVPTGAFVLFAGLTVLTGLIGPGWSWDPNGFSITLTGAVGVPLVAVFAGLLGGWTTARVYGGFGAGGRQTGAYALIGTNAAAMLALLLLIVSFIAVRGFGPMIEGIKLGLFWGPWTWFRIPLTGQWLIVEGPILWFYWPFVMEGYSLGSAVNGILPAIVGTVWLVVGAVLFAVPLGVGAAVYLTEYAEQGRFTFLVEISTNGLWSTPSIVYGLFGLAFLVPRIGNTSSLLTGQLVLGFMLLPLVLITSRESLKSVPGEYRDASAALGVNRWETVKSVVLPAAMPGVVTGIILGVGRIAGETAPILLVVTSDPFPAEAAHVVQGSFRFVSSFPFVAVPTIDLVQPSSALPYQLFAVITAGLQENLSFAWGTALVLLLVVMSLYAVGVASRIYFRRKINE